MVASPSRSQRSGFTLVELLVVIGIIALLVSILLPSLNKARASANNIVCQSNLRQMGIIYQMYLHDNNGYLIPSAGGWDAPYWLDDTQQETHPNPRWDARLAYLLGNYKILNCPQSNRLWDEQVSYSYSWVPWQLADLVPVFAPEPSRRRKISNISAPRMQIMLWDGPETYPRQAPGFNNPTMLNQVQYRHGSAGRPNSLVGKINCLTLDFAVHTATYDDLMNLQDVDYRWAASLEDPGY